MPEATPVEPELLRDWPLPPPGEDKEARGRVLLVGGSRETPGAILLAAEAALRVGAGKVRLATAASCAAALGVAVPEARVTGLAEDELGNIAVGEAERVRDLAGGCGTVLLGPGITDVDAASRLLDAVVPRLDATVVIDALGSAFVTDDPERLATVPGSVVLTLNPTELARCLGADEGDVVAQPEEHALALARRTGAVVLCGGTSKVVAYDDRLWRVDAGNPGLAISGSGDAQAGIVTGLLGRGAEPDQAAVWGAFLHATAGDLLARRIGPVGYLARELPGELPGLVAELGGPSPGR